MRDEIKIDLFREENQWRATVTSEDGFETVGRGNSPMVAVASLMNTDEFINLITEQVPKKQPKVFMIIKDEMSTRQRHWHDYVMVALDGEIWEVTRCYSPDIDAVRIWDVGRIVQVLPLPSIGVSDWDWQGMRCRNAKQLESLTPGEAAQCFIGLGDSVAAAMKEQFESGEDLVKALGFDDLADLAKLLDQLDFTTNETRKSFRNWKRDSSTKDDLLRLTQGVGFATNGSMR
jgi:hypothetical protein